jgi:16S rRNA (adenine1518-N6/adenine1519-N6)-dimethyltransferase
MAHDPLAALRQAGIKPKKGLGQNFLTDQAAVEQIIESANVDGADTVVEVGPGPGILTPGLCERAGKVIAVELDERMIPVLEKATAAFDNIDIRQEDILKIEPTALPKTYKVVANVPYYITSAIIKHFLESVNRPSEMVLTIQAEVAERIVAQPPKMSVLAVSVQLYGKPEIVGRIPAAAFSPAPEVDSAILRISNIGLALPETLGELSEEQFFNVVKAGFAEKRKQIHNSLARNLSLSHDEAVAVLTAADIEPSRRAETLTIAEWVALTRAVTTT